jgi:putative hydrolase of the HAD superfamily
VKGPRRTHVFFDVGGVLGTNGWDREQRRAAADRFALDAAQLDLRHKEIVAAWEEGRVSWDEYLDFTVFDAPHDFSRDEFKAYVLGLSEPFDGSVAVARALRARGDLRLCTLNNESAELNAHRIARFELRPLFDAFCSSCWLGVRKPERAMYTRSLAIGGAEPAAALLVDDREQNLAPARALGMSTIHFESPLQLRSALAALGLLEPA